ncbi:tyrosine-type recombinase/integrase [candidate division WOR-3 bacterium]|nr:tyrosine-type recombinase/integrase [candidate division WOR-3 bacterium]
MLVIAKQSHPECPSLRVRRFSGRTKQSLPECLSLRSNLIPSACHCESVIFLDGRSNLIPSACHCESVIFLDGRSNLIWSVCHCESIVYLDGQSNLFPSVRHCESERSEVVAISSRVSVIARLYEVKSWQFHPECLSLRATNRSVAISSFISFLPIRISVFSLTKSVFYCIIIKTDFISCLSRACIYESVVIKCIKEKISTDPRTGIKYRHHIYETVLQKAVKQAIKKAGIVKQASYHTFRHSFATYYPSRYNFISLYMPYLSRIRTLVF